MLAGLVCYSHSFQVKLCGHATLAAAHSLFSSDRVDSDVIEFETLSGILTAKRVLDCNTSSISETQNGAAAPFFIELDFPLVSAEDYGGEQWSLISKALNGTSVIEMKMTAADDLLVNLSSLLYFSTLCSSLSTKNCRVGKHSSNGRFSNFSRK